MDMPSKQASNHVKWQLERGRTERLLQSADWACTYGARARIAMQSRNTNALGNRLAHRKRGNALEVKVVQKSGQQLNEVALRT